MAKSPTPAVQAKKPTPAPRPGQRKARPALAAAPTREPEADDEPEAPSVPSAPRAFFLIGENKKIAGDVAEHEWGWTRTRTGWTGAPSPGEVKFLADLAAVKAEAAKGQIAVYEGYKWYVTIAPHLLQLLVDEGTVIKIPAPASF